MALSKRKPAHNFNLDTDNDGSVQVSETAADTLQRYKAALVSMANYCAYQERSPADVSKKMISEAIDPSFREDITARLVQDGYIDPSRFATNYSSGKAKYNNWGKIKVKQGLLAKGIDHALAAKAISETESLGNPDLYFANALKLGKAKWISNVTKTPENRKAALMRYLASKGYEAAIAFKVLNQIASTAEDQESNALFDMPEDTEI